MGKQSSFKTKKGRTMNPLIQFKKIPNLPLLIGTGARHRRVDTCAGVRNAPGGCDDGAPWYGALRRARRLGKDGQVEGPDRHEGRIGPQCRPRYVSTRGVYWVAYASRSQPGHGHVGHRYRIRRRRPELHSARLFRRDHLRRTRKPGASGEEREYHRPGSDGRSAADPGGCHEKDRRAEPRSLPILRKGSDGF